MSTLSRMKKRKKKQDTKSGVRFAGQSGHERNSNQIKSRRTEIQNWRDINSANVEKDNKSTNRWKNSLKKKVHVVSTRTPKSEVGFSGHGSAKGNDFVFPAKSLPCFRVHLPLRPFYLPLCVWSCCTTKPSFVFFFLLCVLEYRVGNCQRSNGLLYLRAFLFTASPVNQNTRIVTNKQNGIRWLRLSVRVGGLDGKFCVGLSERLSLLFFVFFLRGVRQHFQTRRFQRKGGFASWHWSWIFYQ